MTDGACMMCATESETVRPYSFGANFTSYNELAAGDGLCSKCVELIEDRSSRQKSWIIEAGKRTILERSDWISTLSRDKTTPFTIYLTTSHKMQGFIPIMSRPNHGNRTYVLAHDRSVIRVDRDSLPGLLADAEYLRDRRWSKNEMVGEPVAERYFDPEAVNRWRKACANQAWPVIVGGLEPLQVKQEAAAA